MQAPTLSSRLSGIIANRRLGVRYAALLLVAYVAVAALDANVATALAAGLALFGAALTLSHADATARRARTAEYRARWDHPDLLATRIVASEFLTHKGTSEDNRWREWKKWLETGSETEKRLQIMAILNYWEELASAYNRDLLDGAWFRTDLAWQLEHNWNRAGWFIRKFRLENQNAAYFCEWQNAVEAVKDDLAQQVKDGRRRAREALDNGQDLLDVTWD